MGADDGDPDERPVHPVELGAFWITDVPITWSAYHALMGWPPPPNGMPPAAAMFAIEDEISAHVVATIAQPHGIIARPAATFHVPSSRMSSAVR